MPRFVAQPKRSRGRSGTLWTNARKKCLSLSQLCWICAGECQDFQWEKLPFDSAAIDMSLAWPHPGSASVDHIIPISQLAADDPLLWKQENLRPAHLKCNSARGTGAKSKVVCRTSRNWLA